jgi:hypothetical protein
LSACRSEVSVPVFALVSFSLLSQLVLILRAGHGDGVVVLKLLSYEHKCSDAEHHGHDGIGERS